MINLCEKENFKRAIIRLKVEEGVSLSAFSKYIFIKQNKKFIFKFNFFVKKGYIIFNLLLENRYISILRATKFLIHFVKIALYLFQQVEIIRLEIKIEKERVYGKYKRHGSIRF